MRAVGTAVRWTAAPQRRRVKTTKLGVECPVGRVLHVCVIDGKARFLIPVLTLYVWVFSLRCIEPDSTTQERVAFPAANLPAS